MVHPQPSGETTPKRMVTWVRYTYIHHIYVCMYIYIYINAHNTYTRYRNYSPLKIFCQSNNHKFWWENSWSVSLREKKQWFAVNFFYRIRYGKAPKNNAFTLCPGPLSETGGIRVYDIPYIYSISQLSYTIHRPYIDHTYTIHIPYIYHTYTIHIPYIYSLPAIHHSKSLRYVTQWPRMDMPDEKAIEEFGMKTQLTSLPRDHPQWKQLVVVGSNNYGEWYLERTSYWCL